MWRKVTIWLSDDSHRKVNETIQKLIKVQNDANLTTTWVKFSPNGKKQVYLKNGVPVED